MRDSVIAHVGIWAVVKKRGPSVELDVRLASAVYFSACWRKKAV